MLLPRTIQSLVRLVVIQACCLEFLEDIFGLGLHTDVLLADGEGTLSIVCLIDSYTAVTVLLLHSVRECLTFPYHIFIIGIILAIFLINGRLYKLDTILILQDTSINLTSLANFAAFTGTWQRLMVALFTDSISFEIIFSVVALC